MKIGLLGGGQLGRMLALSGYPLGMNFRVFDPAVDACAGQVAEHVTAPYGDEDALDRFASGLDLVTWEFENVPLGVPRRLESRVRVYPPANALSVAQDRLFEKHLFESVGLPTVNFRSVASLDDLGDATSALGFPCVLKTRRMGYDGKGQAILRSEEDLSAAWERLGRVPSLVESRVAFDREVSLIAVRDISQEIGLYSPTINEHRDGILRTSRVPGESGGVEGLEEATQGVRRLLAYLNYVGVLAVEFFEVGGVLVANEIAPRVHNSGHWTVDGAVTSQFENHLRAVAGLPLGSTDMLGVPGMVNLIGAIPPPSALLEIPEVHLHLYGKVPRPGRKVGHANVVAASDARLDAVLDQVQELISAQQTGE